MVQVVHHHVYHHHYITQAKPGKLEPLASPSSELLPRPAAGPPPSFQVKTLTSTTTSSTSPHRQGAGVPQRQSSWSVSPAALSGVGVDDEQLGAIYSAAAPGAIVHAAPPPGPRPGGGGTSRPRGVERAPSIDGLGETEPSLDGSYPLDGSGAALGHQLGDHGRLGAEVPPGAAPPGHSGLGGLDLPPGAVDVDLLNTTTSFSSPAVQAALDAVWDEENVVVADAGGLQRVSGAGDVVDEEPPSPAPATGGEFSLKTVTTGPAEETTPDTTEIIQGPLLTNQAVSEHDENTKTSSDPPGVLGVGVALGIPMPVGEAPEDNASLTLSSEGDFSSDHDVVLKLSFDVCKRSSMRRVDDPNLSVGFGGLLRRRTATTTGEEGVAEGEQHAGGGAAPRKGPTFREVQVYETSEKEDSYDSSSGASASSGAGTSSADEDAAVNDILKMFGEAPER